MREIKHRYLDPVDLIWLKTASRLGMTVNRSDEVFAAWDGKSSLTLSTPQHFDADDCLAQLILHELCHAVIEGPDGQNKTDWGLNNTDERHLVHEHACHRLQAKLTQPFGLRTFFAVTTEWRSYYDALPTNALQGKDDPATEIAAKAYREFDEHPFKEAIFKALSATALIAEATRGFTDPKSLWSRYKPI